MNDTLAYYNNDADMFVESTFEVTMEELYQEFLPRLPKGGQILGAGCGSGRASLRKGLESVGDCSRYMFRAHGLLGATIWEGWLLPRI